MKYIVKYMFNKVGSIQQIYSDKNSLLKAIDRNLDCEPNKIEIKLISPSKQKEEKQP